MLNQNGSICLDWLTDQFKLHQRIWMLELPNWVINFLNIHAHFLMSRESRICKWRDLSWIKVKRLLNDEWIWLESNFLTIFDNFIRSILINSLNDEHWSCNRLSQFRVWCTSISFFMSCYFISKVKWKIRLCLFIQKHDFVSKSNKAVFWERLRHFLRSTVFWLSDVNGK